jgi:hypothetical protein
MARDELDDACCAILVKRDQRSIEFRNECRQLSENTHREKIRVVEHELFGLRTFR